MPEVAAALIAAGAALLVAWMQYGNRKELRHTRAAAEKTVEQTDGVSNGFAAGTQEALDELKKALENQDRRRDRTDLWTAQLLAKFDDRLLRIEELCQSTEPDSQSRQRTEKQ